MMITFDEALRIILDRSRPVTRTVESPIEETATRVLAEDVIAPFDIPGFRRAMMDGFAFRHDEASRGCLRIAGAVAAGECLDGTLEQGFCVRIMTGAPLPDGADTVIPLEEAEDCGAEIRFGHPPDRGRHVSPRGEDVQAGSTVLRDGHLIGAQELGILAAVGRRTVRIVAAPVVAFAVTGDELVEPGRPLPCGAIYNSNGFVLRSQIAAAGGSACDLGVVQDREEAVARAIREGLAHDILIFTGGVSRGVRDLVPPMLARGGVEILFHGIRVHPGQPTLFGIGERTLVFGLAGNPWAALLGYELYVAPALRAAQRKPNPEGTSYRGELTSPLTKKPGFARLVPCVREWRSDRFCLTPLRTHGSADIFSAPGADSVAIVPAESGSIRAGEFVRFHALSRP
jgi:molybdopterin molybdotransferase